MTIGNAHLTERAPAYNATEPGMAFCAGSGSLGKACKDCCFKGYFREREEFDPAQDKWITRTYRTRGCAKFLALTGEHGPAIVGALRACKYFEAK
jgi:hypothetical protein